MPITSQPVRNYLAPGSLINFNTAPASLNNSIPAPDYFVAHSAAADVLTEQVVLDNTGYITTFTVAELINSNASVYVRTTSFTLNARPRILFYSGTTVIGAFNVPAFNSGINDCYFNIPLISIRDCRISITQLNSVADAGSFTSLLLLTARSLI